MKVVILCGGLGTRLREETEFRPKPMVEIGARPILWHIMRHYARFGFDEFVLCLGYKGDVIRNYFIDYHAMNADVEVRIGTHQLAYLEPLRDEARWSVILAETGALTPTGGRILRVASRYAPGETFLCTYGDGLSNVNISDLLAFHRRQGRLVTVTGVRPFTRFGELEVQDGLVRTFYEKPQLREGWINGGFFVFEPDALRYLSDDGALEGAPLERLASDNQLAVYEHSGYWAAMDTYREALALNEEWNSGKPAWLDP